MNKWRYWLDFTQPRHHRLSTVIGLLQVHNSYSHLLFIYIPMLIRTVSSAEDLLLSKSSLISNMPNCIFIRLYFSFRSSLEIYGVCIFGGDGLSPIVIVISWPLIKYLAKSDPQKVVPNEIRKPHQWPNFLPSKKHPWSMDDHLVDRQEKKETSLPFSFNVWHNCPALIPFYLQHRKIHALQCVQSWPDWTLILIGSLNEHVKYHIYDFTCCPSSTCASSEPQSHIRRWFLFIYLLAQPAHLNLTHIALGIGFSNKIGGLLFVLYV